MMKFGWRDDQLLYKPRHRARPSILKSILVVRGGDIDDGQLSQLRMFFADEPEIAVHVVALGFGQAGGGDADDLRLGAVPDIQDGLLDVVHAAEDGGRLVHGGGLERNVFPEMAHEQHQAEGGAALRAVQCRHALV